MNYLNKTVYDILHAYTFPHRFYVRYAYVCANEVRHLMTAKASTDALDLVQKWLYDANAVTKEELREAADKAYADSYTAASNASYASNASHNAASNAYYAASFAAANAASNAAAIYNASYAASYAQSAKPEPKGWTKDLLLQMINDLSNTEKLIIFGKTT